jgi:hypothetical protein
MKIKSKAELALDKALEERGLKKGEKPKKKKLKK